MMSRLCILCLVAVLVVLSGCVNPDTRPDLSLKEQEMVQEHIHEFMENPGYTINMSNITEQEGLLLIMTNDTLFFINPVNYSVSRAEFSGQNAILSVTNTTLHGRAIEGIQSFFQDESFNPEITRIRYHDDRYEIEGPGMFFRVNATTGAMISFRLIGNESVQALNGSEQYAGAREALTRTV